MDIYHIVLIIEIVTILLHRAATHKAPKLPPSDCFAVVSDVPLETGGRPCFPLDDPEPLADFLLSQLQ